MSAAVNPRPQNRRLTGDCVLRVVRGPSVDDADTWYWRADMSRPKRPRTTVWTGWATESDAENLATAAVNGLGPDPSDEVLERARVAAVYGVGAKRTPREACQDRVSSLAHRVASDSGGAVHPRDVHGCTPSVNQVYGEWVYMLATFSRVTGVFQGVKLGFTSRWVWSRACDLRTGTPLVVVPIAAIAGSVGTEALAHELAAPFLIRGEWYTAGLLDLMLNGAPVGPLRDLRASLLGGAAASGVAAIESNLRIAIEKGGV